MKENDDGLRATAFHEAGHVFMFELVGLEYEDVSINGEEGIVNGYDNIKTDNMLNKFIFACICFSGSIAEDLYIYPIRLDDALESIYESDLYGSSLNGSGKADNDKYEEMGMGLDGCYKKSLLKVTRKIIVDSWSMVSIIANSLAEHKRLTDKEVKKLLGDFKLKEKYDISILELQAILYYMGRDSPSID